MSNWEKIGGLRVAKSLKNLVEQEVLKGIELDASEVWSKLESILQEFMPRNKALLQKRQDIQKKIDSWHAERAGQAIDGVVAGPDCFATSVKTSDSEEAKNENFESHEFEFDLRQSVNWVLRKICAHFKINDPDTLWVFRSPPAQVPGQ